MKRRPALATAIGVSASVFISILTFGFLWMDSERRAAEDREEQQALTAKAAKKAEDEAKAREKQETLAAIDARNAADKEKRLRTEADQQRLCASATSRGPGSRR